MDWQKHTGNKQPVDTYDKWIIYKTHGSNLIHKSHTANDMNWKTTETDAPTIGMIESYRVIK